MGERDSIRLKGSAIVLYLLFCASVLLLSAVDLQRSRASAMEQGFERAEAAAELLSRRLQRSIERTPTHPCARGGEHEACARWVQGLRIPEAISLALFDSEQVLLARIPDEGAPIGESLHSNPVLAEIVAGERSFGRFERASVYDGIERLYAVQRIPGSELTLVTGLTRHEALEGWRRYLVLHLLITLGLFLLASLLFWRHVHLVNTQEMVERDRDAATGLRESLEAEVHRHAVSQQELHRVIDNAQLLAATGAELLEARGKRARDVLRRPLQPLREHFGADRSSLMLISEDQQRLVEVIEVCAAGVEPNGDQLPEALGDGFPLLRMIALHQPHLYVRDMAQLPAFFGEEAQQLAALGVASMLLCPLVVGERIVGLLTLDCEEGLLDLDLQDLALMRIIGDSFANTLLRLDQEARLHLSEARFRALSDNAENLPIQSYDREGRVVLWSRGSELLYGYRAAEVIGRRATEFLDDERSIERMERYLESLAAPISGEHRAEPEELTVRHADGHPVHVVTQNVAFNPQGAPIEFYAVDVDVTGLRSLETRLRNLATRDELTGVASRRAFLARLDREVALMQRHGWPLAVLMVDADHFKAINDRNGHAAGDAVLRTLGRVLRDTVRETDLIGRLGGEEFALALPRTGPEAALVVASRIRASVARSETPFEGACLRFTVSVGVGVVEEPERLADTLLSHADAALYAAKRSGRDRVMLWTDSMPAIGTGPDLEDSFDQPISAEDEP